MDTVIGGLTWFLNHLLVIIIAVVIIYLGPGLTWRIICTLYSMIGAWGLYTVTRNWMFR